MTPPKHRVASSVSHPALQDLAAYSEKRLSKFQREFVRSHLVACDRCASVVLDLAEATDFDLKSSAVTTDVSDSWKQLRKALDEEGLWHSPRRKVDPWNVRWRRLALAASLAAVTLAGTSAWLWHRSSVWMAPQVDPPWLSLAPLGEVRSGTREALPELALSPGARGWISFVYPSANEYSEIRVQFFREPDAILAWWWSGPQPEDPRILRLELTLRELPLGTYRVELAGRRVVDGPWDALARYSLRVVAPARP